VLENMLARIMRSSNTSKHTIQRPKSTHPSTGDKANAKVHGNRRRIPHQGFDFVRPLRDMKFCGGNRAFLNRGGGEGSLDHSLPSRKICAVIKVPTGACCSQAMRRL
jgi:hypothetical protein